MLKHLRIRNVEVARRVYFAVRDKDWDTINPVIAEFKVERTPSVFVATWIGRCQKGSEIDDVWKGRLELLAEGIVKFTGSGCFDRVFHAAE